MYGVERHQLIVEEARRAGRVEVAVLAERFEVTTETIRRDLTALERQGLLHRVHGGAIPIERLGFEPGLDERAVAQVAEKTRIGRKAIDEIPIEGAVFLDAGTTTAKIAEFLPPERELTVVTNSLPIAVSLSGRPRLTLLMVGGRIRGRTLAAVGPWAEGAIGDTFVDVAFLGANGISPQRGFTTADQVEAATKSAVLAASRRSIVVADHTKLGINHFARFAALEDIDTLITDSDADNEIVMDLEAAGLMVTRA